MSESSAPFEAAAPVADADLARRSAPLRALLGGLRDRVPEATPVRVAGLVTHAGGLVIEGCGPASAVGGLCEIQSPGGEPLYFAEVVGFRGTSVLLMPLGQPHGLEPGCRIVRAGHRADVPVGPALIGRVINGLGQPIDGKGPIATTARRPLYVDPINPMEREPIAEVLDLGVRAVNAMLTVGKGQRVGIMAGSGVGKSTLLGMMARYTKADVNVIGLIGERGRELREFIDRDLGPEGLARSVVVVATSDDAPLVRRRGAFLATAIAEYFRDRDRDVLLMMDSVTRFAMAQREIGLAVGEPPATRGYPPSVFAQLPRLMERAGRGRGRGSITGLYTVLVEGDDMNEPIADTARSVLDGHIALTRRLADRGQYPAIDVLQSVSRLIGQLADAAQRRAATTLRRLLAVHADAEDLVNIGAYVPGQSAEIDEALRRLPAIRAFLAQPIDERAPFEESVQALAEVVGDAA